MQSVRVTPPAAQPPYTPAAAGKTPISGAGHYQLLNRANDNDTPSSRPRLSPDADALLETGNVYRSTTTTRQSRTCWQVFRSAETYKTLEKVLVTSACVSVVSIITFGLLPETTPVRGPLALTWAGASILTFASLAAMVTNWAFAVRYGLPDTNTPANISMTGTRPAGRNEDIRPQ